MAPVGAGPHPWAGRRGTDRARRLRRTLVAGAVGRYGRACAAGLTQLFGRSNVRSYVAPRWSVS